jgi:hypothetical protein
MSEPQISEKQPTSLFWRLTSAKSVNISWKDIAFHIIKETVILFYRLQQKAASGSRTHVAVPLIIQME